MQAKVETEQKPEEIIEYETVSLKVPKKVMNWLRALEKGTQESPIEQLEYIILDEVRASIDGVTGKELIDWFGLDPIFLQLLNYR
jgi:hypothetical protein